MKRKLLLALVCCLFMAKADVFATTWTVNVGEGGTMTFDPSSLTIVLGDTVKWVWVTGSHTTTSTSVPSGAAAWDEPINSSATTYIYVPTVTGDYSYKCTPHASMGMVGSFTVNACVAPVSTTIFGATSMCAGNTETLVVPAGPDYMYAWYKNGAVVPGADSNMYMVTDTDGVFTYSVVVSNSCGRDTTDTFTLVINPVPTPVINDTAIDGTVVFSTDELFGATYLWDFGDGSTSTEANPMHGFAMDGVFDTVMLTVTSIDSCAGTATKVIATPGLGVNILTADNAITISPNPAKTEAVINYNIPVNAASIKMTDIMGNVVYTTSLTSQQGRISIPVSDLPMGLYIVEVNAGNARYVQKLVKQ